MTTSHRVTPEYWGCELMRVFLSHFSFLLVELTLPSFPSPKLL